MDRKRTSSQTDDLELLKKELMSAISHTVRTPLSIVKEGLSLVLDEIPGQLNPKQKKILGVAKKNVDRLTQSVEKVLNTPWDDTIKQTLHGKENKEI